MTFNACHHIVMTQREKAWEVGCERGGIQFQIHSLLCLQHNMHHSFSPQGNLWGCTESASLASLIVLFPELGCDYWGNAKNKTCPCTNTSFSGYTYLNAGIPYPETSSNFVFQLNLVPECPHLCQCIENFNLWLILILFYLFVVKSCLGECLSLFLLLAQPLNKTNKTGCTLCVVLKHRVA